MNKQNGVFALILFLFVGIHLSAQNKEIKTGADSLSYSFGLHLSDFEVDLLMHYNDVRDDSVKRELSTKGLIEGLNSTPEEWAYTLGTMTAARLFKSVEALEKYVGEENVNTPLIIEGIEAGLSGRILPESEISAGSFSFLLYEMGRRKYADRIREAEQFFEENGKKSGVVILPSGLQYEVLTKGKGKIPKKYDNVTINCIGTLIDGTEFENSYNDGDASVTAIDINKTIDGLVEALQLMPVGSKWKLYIPYELGFGTMGNSYVPPYSTLIYEVDLIRIEK